MDGPWALTPKNNLTGLTFGRWLVLAFEGRDRHGKRVWRCHCSCQRERVMTSTELRSPKRNSCVCVRRGNYKHGQSLTPEYTVWAGMIQRCTNPNHIVYRHYGGRGITVCERWRNSFSDFISDMGQRPSPKHSLDRIDNAGNYESGNCKWVEKSVQARNTRRNHFITWNGKTQTATDWSTELHITFGTVVRRSRAGINLSGTKKEAANATSITE